MRRLWPMNRHSVPPYERFLHVRLRCSASATANDLCEPSHAVVTRGRSRRQRRPPEACQHKGSENVRSAMPRVRQLPAQSIAQARQAHHPPGCDDLSGRPPVAGVRRKIDLAAAPQPFRRGREVGAQHAGRDSEDVGLARIVRVRVDAGGDGAAAGQELRFEFAIRRRGHGRIIDGDIRSAKLAAVRILASLYAGLDSELGSFGRSIALEVDASHGSRRSPG